MTDVNVAAPYDPAPKEEVARFQAPAIQHNLEGWGPCELPDQFKDIPYQPFSKGDRLGKVRGIWPSHNALSDQLLTHCRLFLVDLRLDHAGLPG